MKWQHVSAASQKFAECRWNQYAGWLTSPVARESTDWSSTADVLEPNDVDCVLLIEAGFPRDEAAEAELLAGLPFLELSLVTQEAFDLLIDEFFATDRQSIGKGMVEVIQ